MQKKTVAKQSPEPASNEKSLFRQAGELLGSIGHHIVEGKDKMVEFVSDEVTIAKKAIKKKLARKAVPKKKTVKKAAKKVTKKATKTKKPVTKFVRKAKKAAKKSASNRMKK